jgi:hypothetical protein
MGLACCDGEGSDDGIFVRLVLYDVVLPPGGDGLLPSEEALYCPAFPVLLLTGAVAPTVLIFFPLPGGGCDALKWGGTGE